MKIFVVAPHKSDPNFEIKRTILLSIAVETKTDILFAKDENTDRNTEESLALLVSSDFVIADLSFERPSCYFEVGFAQAKDKKVFLIAITNTTIYQVKSKSEVRFYNNLDDYEKIVIEILKANKSSSKI